MRVLRALAGEAETTERSRHQKTEVIIEEKQKIPAAGKRNPVCASSHGKRNPIAAFDRGIGKKRRTYQPYDV